MQLPQSINKGDPLATSWLNQIVAALIGRVTVTGGGRAKRIGPNLLIEIDPARGGGTPAGVDIKFDGTRADRCYTGHILNKDGTLGAACQFVIENDPGVDDLVGANNTVKAEPCPARLATLDDWSPTGGTKYVVPAPPFGMIT